MASLNSQETAYVEESISHVSSLGQTYEQVLSVLCVLLFSPRGVQNSVDIQSLDFYEFQLLRAFVDALYARDHKKRVSTTPYSVRTLQNEELSRHQGVVGLYAPGLYEQTEAEKTLFQKNHEHHGSAVYFGQTYIPFHTAGAFSIPGGAFNFSKKRSELSLGGISFERRGMMKRVLGIQAPKLIEAFEVTRDDMIAVLCTRSGNMWLHPDKKTKDFLVKIV